MSMISELIKELREQAFSYKWAANTKMQNLLEKAAETIESISSKLQAANCGGGWIPCSERMPESNGEYICTQEIRSLSSGKILRKSVEVVGFRNGEWMRAKHLKVIAWQPLPEPYHE